MSYAEEMGLGAVESQTEMGEDFTYDGGVTPLKGTFSDTDPESVFMAVGKKTQRALLCDALASQFQAMPIAGKKLVYSGDGKTYVVRLAFPITGGLYRLDLYQL